MKALLLKWLKLAVVQPMAAGIVADESAVFGLLAFMSNGNAYMGGKSIVVTAGTDSTLTAAQVMSRLIRLTAGASGGFSITLPSTSSIISAMGPTINTDGTYSQFLSILNDGVGQTGTLTVGDASTTLTGTATIATDTRRDFCITVTAAGTLTVQNMGSAAI